MKTLTIEENPENPGLKLLLLDDGRFEVTGFPDDPLIVRMGKDGVSEQALLGIVSHLRGGAVVVHTMNDEVSGVEAIWLERRRQIEGMGFDARHDDACGPDSIDDLAAAGLCYAAHATSMMRGIEPEPGVPQAWPWAAEWWKPSKDPLRDLQKAGALIAAQWDRLARSKRRNPAKVSDAGDSAATATAPAPDVEVCEWCNAPAVTHDAENTPLCAECAKVYIDEGENTPDQTEAPLTDPKPPANETDATGTGAGNPEGAA